MPVSDLNRMLSDSAESVLESMFFTSLIGDAASGVPSVPGISASLSFLGKPSGNFGVQVPLETGRKLAASFLGMEEAVLTDSEIREVVCELANMICGSVLSCLESEAGFELSHPELGPGETSCLDDGSTTARTFELDEGTLQLWLKWGPAQ